MAIEIERKFLLSNETWRSRIERSEKFRQGYLTTHSNCSIRIRICETRAWLNIKSAVIGRLRDEYEYQIPLADAEQMIDGLCSRPLIEKTRHYITVDQHIWEIDEFEGENRGLIVAEIELSSLDQCFDRPVWIGLEVTDDLRYYNNRLSIKPYSKWS